MTYENIGLFFYGIGANLVTLFGCVVLIIGLGLSVAFQSGILICVAFIIGVVVILVGKSLRFNFQRQSGSIIHRGDW